MKEDNMNFEFYVIATVGKQDYVTKLIARNAAHAEHQILDMGYCGKHEYGVEACCAYDTDALRTEAFASALHFAEPVSVTELGQIIEVRNAEIKLNEMAEARKDEINKQIKELRSQIEALEDELEEVERV